jgi:hypothetical protein
MNIVMKTTLANALRTEQRRHLNSAAAEEQSDEEGLARVHREVALSFGTLASALDHEPAK